MVWDFEASQILDKIIETDVELGEYIKFEFKNECMNSETAYMFNPQIEYLY